MLRTLILGAAVALSATVALPASAEAQGYYRDGYRDGHYRDGYRRDRRYRGDRRYRHHRRYYRPRTRVIVSYGPGYYGYNPYYLRRAATAITRPAIMAAGAIIAAAIAAATAPPARSSAAPPAR